MKKNLLPRRALLALTALVLAGHWLALAHLPLGSGDAPIGQPAPTAFQTRLLAAAPPSPPSPPSPLPPRPEAAEAAPAATPAPARPPRPQPAPRPKPAPAPAPQPETAAPADDAAAAAPPQPARTYADDVAFATAAELFDTAAPVGADAVDGADGADSADSAGGDAALPDPAAPAASDPVIPAIPATPAAPATAPPAASEPAAAAAPPAVPTTPANTAAPEVTGVDIRAPGAGAPLLQGVLPPVRLPPPARLAFEVQGQAKRLHYRASAELTWQHDGQHYQARQQIKAFLLGTRAQTSTGRITAHGLQPERFGDKSRSERAAHFDFAQGQATFSANAPPASIHEGAQDRLSVFLQLGAMLAAAPERYPAGTHITLTTVGVKNADRWTFTVQGQEQLELPIGSVPALKLQRVPREGKDYDQTAELWLGTQLGYLPVRIRITQANGDFADLLLDGQSEP